MADRQMRRKSYYVAVSRTDAKSSWQWELRRKRNAMGVKLTGDGFCSSEDAQVSGKRALEDFLNGLSLLKDLS
jgi:hypothetical protein